MRILILGAGATGGYFGGRLAKAGCDVTFLVRPARAAKLARDGLIVESPKGDVHVPVKAIVREQIAGPFDAIILSCKSYDLDAAIEAIRPAAGANTLVLPFLNGMAHIDVLDAAFGQACVLGGTCHISVTLTDTGTIRHLNSFDVLTLGARTPSQSERCEALYIELARGAFETRHSRDIILAMWEKWVLLATLAGMTCLMRANIGEIVATGNGAAQISTMLKECCEIAAATGNTPSDLAVETARTVLTDPESKIAASMLRDLQRGARVEASHIIGDLLSRGGAAGVPAPHLAAAYTHLEAYQNRLAGAV